MKIRRSYIILDILAASCFAGAHLLKKYAETRLGFARWLNFNGNKITEAVPEGKVKFIMTALIVLLAVTAVVLTSVRKTRFAGINGIVMCAATVAAAAYYIYASATFDYAYSRAYFLIVPVVALGALLLAVRTIIPAPVPAKKSGDPESLT